MLHKFTATQRRILEVLADGMPHLYEELKPCFSDPLSGKANLRDQICRMRKILRIRGEDIVCEYRYMRFAYRHIILKTRGHTQPSPTLEPSTIGVSEVPTI